MKRTDRLSIMRLSYLIVIAITFVVGTLVLCYYSSMLLDQVICLVAIDVCFVFAFVLGLTRRRLLNTLPEKVYLSYGKLAISIFLCFVLLVLSSIYAPDFFAPVMIFPILLSSTLDKSGTIILSSYFVVLLCVTQNYGVYLLLCYWLIIIFGSLLADFTSNIEPLKILYSYIFIFAINVLLSVIFYYFNYVEIGSSTFLYCLIDSGIVVIVCAIAVPLLNKSIKSMDIDIYDMILDPSYDLCEDIRKFSFIEYQHALRVSRLSRLCAKEIGADENLAAAGGFYYRLGKMEGEPMIDNAIKLANNHCFPEELIKLMSEYGGIISLPSTKESAIVHMVDSVVTKVELFDSDSMSSTWNQNMVIYQTINELSQKGLYDDSTLSMNQFLTIREKLANEDILA